MRLRRVVKSGNSYFIRLIPQDLVDLKLKIGMEVDIEDAVTQNEQNTKRAKGS